AEELTARTFQDITHPDDLDTDLEHVRQLLAAEATSYQMEKRYYHRLGHVVWVLLSVSLVRASDGSPVHFISQIQDITERKEAEEERDLLRDELHHIQKLDAIGQLAGGIAHDFNNTLTAIRGYGELLAAALPDEGPLRRYAEEIRKTAEIGAALPRQLLAF